MKSSGKRVLPDSFLQGIEQLRRTKRTTTSPGATVERTAQHNAHKNSAVVQRASGRREAQHATNPAARSSESSQVRTPPAEYADFQESKSTENEKHNLVPVTDLRIPAANFYGPKTERGNKITARIRTKAMKISRSQIFREFARQKDAFEYADGVMGESVRVFARELDGHGKRKFLVTTQEELWRRIYCTEQKNRHLYEVIRQGCPAYLYFDVEFNRELNPDLDGDRAMQTLIAFIPEALKQQYPDVQFAIGVQDIVDLDSSTPSKFSRHLIIRPSEGRVVFRNNVHMGAFVGRMAAAIRRRWEEGDEDMARLMVRTGREGGEIQERSVMIDLGVYTKNRCFRLYLSSKFGKQAVLEPSDSAWKFEYAEQLFYRSLVCNVPRDLARDGTVLLDPSLPASVSSSAGLARRLLRAEGGGEGGGAAEGEKESAEEAAVVPAEEMQREWAAVAEFVTEEWNRRAGGARGRVKSVVEARGSALLVFTIVGNRWCDNVGREHRSNGIMLIVNPDRACFYQKCFDPDCRAREARSNDFPVPHQVLRGLAGVVEEAGGEEERRAKGGGREDAGTEEIGEEIGEAEEAMEEEEEAEYIRLADALLEQRREQQQREQAQAQQAEGGGGGSARVSGGDAGCRGVQVEEEEEAAAAARRRREAAARAEEEAEEEEFIRLADHLLASAAAQRLPQPAREPD